MVSRVSEQQPGGRCHTPHCVAVLCDNSESGQTGGLLHIQNSKYARYVHGFCKSDMLYVLLHTAGANYSFASSDKSFLRANFDSQIFDLLPWHHLTERGGVDKQLADVIMRSRGDGTAVLEVCNHRNEAVNSR